MPEGVPIELGVTSDGVPNPALYEVSSHRER